ncbi:prion-like-(Q/N-rich) domain-bearing protein 25 [Arctopsyche grandis]|uniref:prion-like-(Q/N-rich) domain-bearing protein 25 n=1 Tax=Arctopsyche grandis TaxID=121162 RepID=UPI00406D7E8B
MDKITNSLVLLVLIAAEISATISGSLESNSHKQGIDATSCIDGHCSCPSGQQLYHDICMDASPYLFSPCEIDIQCERLSGYHFCDNVTKTCKCKEGYRYLNGRCWPKAEYGEPCITKEQCFHPLQTFSMDCIDGTCQCAKDHYTRQKGECRKIASKKDDTCVLNSDCKIEGAPNAICNNVTMLCTVDSRVTFDPKMSEINNSNVKSDKNVKKVFLGASCTNNDDCAKEHGAAECSLQKHCICKIGYYPNKDNTLCSAELGQIVPSDGKTVCEGRLAIIVDGVCDCPNGFFYETDANRNCKKPARNFKDGCADDDTCYTFGKAGRCTQAEGSIFKNCDCDITISRKDEQNQMCALFEKLIGDQCVPEDVCPTESKCVNKVCECNKGTIAALENSICLQTELELNMACLIDDQCSTKNSKCIQEKCSCQENYYQDGKECKESIGSSCGSNNDCKILNSECQLDSHDSKKGGTCQCINGFLNDEDKFCLQPSLLGESCDKSVQCGKPVDGEITTDCVNGTCTCVDKYHEENEACWKNTGLKGVCSRNSQCYLPDGMSSRVECRNSMCQCKFDYSPQYIPDMCNGANILRGFQLSLIYSLLLIVSVVQN